MEAKRASHPPDGTSRWRAWHPRALLQFLRFACQEFSRIRGFEKASALGFQTVFSLIPGLVLFLSILQIFGALDALSQDITRFIMHQLNLDRIEVRLPEAPAVREESSLDEEGRDGEAGEAEGDKTDTTPTAPQISVKLSDEINRLITGLIQAIRSRSVNLVSLLWFVAAAMSLAITLEAALNEVWGTSSQRSWLTRIVVYWTVLTLGPLLIGLPIHLAQQAEIPLENLVFSFISSVVAFFLIYYWVPVAPVRPRCALLGAFSAAVVWEVAKWLFGLYLEHAVGYGRLYGNLGLLPLTLFWLWIAWVIVLGGAAVAYTAQNYSRLQAAARGLLAQANLNVSWVLLAMVLRLARAFRSGEGPTPAEELATASGLPDRDWQQLVGLLRRRGILVPLGMHEEQFLLGQPADELSVSKLFAMLEEQLPQYFAEQWPSEAPRLQWVYGRWCEAREQALGNVTIAQLLRQPQEAAPEVTEPTKPKRNFLERLLASFRRS